MFVMPKTKSWPRDRALSRQGHRVAGLLPWDNVWVFRGGGWGFSSLPSDWNPAGNVLIVPSDNFQNLSRQMALSPPHQAPAILPPTHSSVPILNPLPHRQISWYLQKGKGLKMLNGVVPVIRARSRPSYKNYHKRFSVQISRKKGNTWAEGRKQASRSHSFPHLCNSYCHCGLFSQI